MSNLGYARGIDGSLRCHMTFGYRHLWCTPATQRRVLGEFQSIISREKPDLCCLAEVDSGSFTSAGFHQLEVLIDEEYRYSDIENKYLAGSRLRSMPLTRGKSNAVLARHPYAIEKLYFSWGTKRLIYKVHLSPTLHLYFTHFSLTKKTRERQLHEMIDLADQSPGDVILLGDFNILEGLDELSPLLAARPWKLLNDPLQPTFRFHRRAALLDLCICSERIVQHAKLTLLPQSFSDHAALLVDVEVPEE